MKKYLEKYKNLNPAAKRFVQFILYYVFLRQISGLIPALSFVDSFLIRFEEIVFSVQAAQLILSLSILVVLHELGHFIPAKLFKTRVEKFYLFFDPWFSVFKKKVGETEYGIGWLPLGGYVKISGMIDESMDKEQMKKPAEPWEFRAKPAWQRLIVMLGGVTVNFLLGIFIYSMTLNTYGEKYLLNDDLVDGVWCFDSIAYKVGFQNGDKVISVDNKKIERFNDIATSLLTGKTVQIERDGIVQEIVIPKNFIEQLIENEKNKSGKRPLFYPRIPTIVSGFGENSNAKKAGLKERDRIVEINGEKAVYFDQLKKELSSCANKTVELKVDREGKEILISCNVDKTGALGFIPAFPNLEQLEDLGLYKITSQKPSFLASFPAGYKKASEKLSSYVDQFMLILKPSTGAYKGMGGFGTIGSLFGNVWDWESFWNLTAFLSLMLAFMNLLPIPALDGGHVVFLIYEIIFRKPAPEKIIEHAQVVGMILLLSLLIFANGNDLLKLF